MLKGLVPILDPGHGGIIGGKYQTSGKRSPNWDQGIIYEGAANRWIVNGVMALMDQLDLPYFNICPELRDVSLEARVRRANAIQVEHPNSYVLSIHHNAGGGTGFEGFTSKGDTPSDPVADRFLAQLEKDFPDETPRFDYYSDGDRDKEVSYRILTGTSGRAVLLELGFMDHRNDYKRILNPKVQRRRIRSLVYCISALYYGSL
ncbi:N-acetylmuramoyl-L-alanine amidase [Robiginitalea biformata]|uniref:Cell wall hydrolase/autolysin n=1 Tax=Robiginitalea biformata (strain ATCC BAA-864 / DSM 15991 / KCTC 12146 / HTCC2501) TaxID=313596 RepID=A4CKQ3_ROBBH|nr:N-acetylmuramoyl-L-alanine amidase [Robiginitalea biformata]EAR15452.1 Cell wall hydrolase/autolysin [Robiginitalea biformata HTCC2501]